MRSPFFFGRTATPETADRAADVRRDPRRSDPAQSIVLLRIVRGLHRPAGAVRVLQRAERGDSQRRLQQRAQRQRHAAADLRPVIWRPRHRHRPRAVREQHHSRRPHERDRADGCRTSIPCRTSRAPGPAASRATTGRTRHASTDRHNYDAKVNWNRTSAHQLWGKYSQMNARGRRSVQLPAGQLRRRWLRYQGASHHRRPDLVVRTSRCCSTARSASR